MSNNVSLSIKKQGSKKQYIINLDKEPDELSSSDMVIFDLFIEQYTKQENALLRIITPSDKPNRRKSNQKPETIIKNNTNKKDIEEYIKANDPDGLAEYNKHDCKEFLKLRKWFFNKYPNYIKDKLKK